MKVSLEILVGIIPMEFDYEGVYNLACNTKWKSIQSELVTHPRIISQAPRVRNNYGSIVWEVFKQNKNKKVQEENRTQNIVLI